MSCLIQRDYLFIDTFFEARYKLRSEDQKKIELNFSRLELFRI